MNLEQKLRSNLRRANLEEQFWFEYGALHVLFWICLALTFVIVYLSLLPIEPYVLDDCKGYYSYFIPPDCSSDICPCVPTNQNKPRNWNISTITFPPINCTGAPLDYICSCQMCVPKAQALSPTSKALLGHVPVFVVTTALCTGWALYFTDMAKRPASVVINGHIKILGPCAFLSRLWVLSYEFSLFGSQQVEEFRTRIGHSYSHVFFLHYSLTG